jgi:outer membrane immunogenic protein
MRTNNLLASTALTTSAMLASTAALAQSGTVYNWTGWYGGLNVGGSWADVSQSVVIPGVLTSSGSSRDGGAIFGFQVGYNWHLAPQWVVGFEGDLSYLSGKRTDAFSVTVDPAGNSEDIVGTQHTKLRWLSTIRGRLGFAWDRSLFYATGGLAIGHVNSSVNANARESDGEAGATAFFGNHASTRVGWTVGGGWQYAVTNTMSVKIEYLHFDLGNVGYNVVGVITGLNGNDGVPLSWPATASFSGDIVRIGVNLKLPP